MDSAASHGKLDGTQQPVLSLKQMPLFFFDELAEGQRIEDDEGIDLPNLEAAILEAIEGAREQIAEAARQGIDATDRRFDVRDHHRHIVFSVEFRDTVRRP